MLRFEDYNEEELFDIAMKMFKDEGYIVTTGAKELINNYCHDIYSKRDKYFGNARTIRKFTGDVIRKQNLRVSLKEAEVTNSRAMNSVTADDIRIAGNEQDDVIYRRRGISY